MERSTEIHDLWMENVVKVGIACGELKQAEHGAGWVVLCQMMRGCGKETAKGAMQTFLEKAWGATRVRFFQKPRNKPYEFYVYFESELM